MTVVEELQNVLDKHFPEDRRYRELSFDDKTEIRYEFKNHYRGYVTIVAGGDGGEIPLKTFTEPEKLDAFLTLIFEM